MDDCLKLNLQSIVALNIANCILIVRNTCSNICCIQLDALNTIACIRSKRDNCRCALIDCERLRLSFDDNRIEGCATITYSFDSQGMSNCLELHFKCIVALDIANRILIVSNTCSDICRIQLHAFNTIACVRCKSDSCRCSLIDSKCLRLSFDGCRIEGCATITHSFDSQGMSNCLELNF